MSGYGINTKDENGAWNPNKHWIKTLKDNGGWAERVASYWDENLEEWVLFDRLETAVVDIRTKVGLGDIAIAPRRYINPPQGRPDSLYEIHVDNGIVKTSIREFPDVDELGWVDQFELGNGTDVAVCFDGRWKLYRAVWRLVTEETPWIFWVNDTDELYGQKWADTSTLILLSTNVNKVSTIRGWNNENIPGNDQGIIVSYIKNDGTLWYKNKCYQESGDYVWENEREITEITQTFSNISLFLTLDYRVGFAVEDSVGNIHWLITPRNWAGLALRPENIYAQSSIGFELYSVSYTDLFGVETLIANSEITISHLIEGSRDNLFSDLLDVNVTTLRFKSKWVLHNYSASSFEIIGETGFNFIATDISFDDEYYILTFEDYENINMFPGEEITLVMHTGTAENEGGYLFNETQATFNSVNLEPDPPPIPTIEGVWNG